MRSHTRDGRGHWGLGLAVCLLTVSVGWGCRGGRSDTAGATAETAAKKKKRRGDVLATLVEMAQPKKLFIETRPETVVSLLNDWVAMGGESFEATEELDEVYKRLLDASFCERVQAPRFARRDASHIRDALWYAAISRVICEGADGDLARANRLFGYATRNIVLRSDDDTLLPLAPFAVAMFGEGNVRDRAWLFANLLRQLRIDAVVFHPPVEGGDVLVGVLLDNHVYLYDPLLGVPVPSGPASEGDAAIKRPATLAAVRANPDLLENLAAGDEGYRFTSQSLAKPVVSIVGATSFWAPRMRRLQLALSSNHDVLLWDPLESSDVVPEGAMARLATAGFDAESVTIWAYPESRMDGNADLSTQQLKLFQMRSRAFESPVPVSQVLANDQTGQVQLKEAERGNFRHRMSRNRQLLGEWQTSVTTYLKIRMWRDVPPLPKSIGFIDRGDQAGLRSLLSTRVRLIHDEAADDAAFWTAICQYEQGAVESAANAMQEYLDRSGPHEWESGAVWLQGLWRGELKQWSQAVAILETIKASDPHHPGARLLLSRFKPLVASEAKIP